MLFLKVLLAIVTIVALVLGLKHHANKRGKLINALKRSGLYEPIVLAYVDDEDWRIAHGEANNSAGRRIRFRTYERLDEDVRLLTESWATGEHFPETSLTV